MPTSDEMRADRERYDVHAKLDDAVGVLSVARGRWEDRDVPSTSVEARWAGRSHGPHESMSVLTDSVVC